MVTRELTEEGEFVFFFLYVCMSGVFDGAKVVLNSLAHQPIDKLGEVPCEASVQKCVTGDVSHIIFWR